MVGICVWQLQIPNAISPLCSVHANTMPSFAVFSKDAVLYANWETKTDKAGVLFAIKYFKENIKKIKETK